MKLLALVMRDGNIEMPDLIQFLRETNQSYFLLGKDISDYLTEIYKRGVKVNFQNKKLNGFGVFSRLLVNNEAN